MLKYLIIVKLCGESDSNETGKLVCLENNNELYKIRTTKKCYLKLVLERLELVPKIPRRLSVNAIQDV